MRGKGLRYMQNVHRCLRFFTYMVGEQHFLLAWRIMSIQDSRPEKRKESFHTSVKIINKYSINGFHGIPVIIEFQIIWIAFIFLDMFPVNFTLQLRTCVCSEKTYIWSTELSWNNSIVPGESRGPVWRMGKSSKPMQNHC